MVLMLAGILGLAGCSSKPSPWAEKSSPWDKPEGQSAEVDSMIKSDEMIEPMPMDQPPIEVMEPEPVVVEEPVVMVSGGSLAQQPDEYFAVQVVASSTMKQLSTFASNNQISEQWVAETMVGGKTWYVLMLGVYPTRAEAEQALSGVSSLYTRPWIRTVGSIKAVMR